MCSEEPLGFIEADVAAFAAPLLDTGLIEAGAELKRDQALAGAHSSTCDLQVVVGIALQDDRVVDVVHDEMHKLGLRHSGASASEAKAGSKEPLTASLMLAARGIARFLASGSPGSLAPAVPSAAPKQKRRRTDEAAQQLESARAAVNSGRRSRSSSRSGPSPLEGAGGALPGFTSARMAVGKAKLGLNLVGSASSGSTAGAGHTSYGVLASAAAVRGMLAASDSPEETAARAMERRSKALERAKKATARA